MIHDKGKVHSTRLDILTGEFYLQTFDGTICAESSVKASEATVVSKVRLSVKIIKCEPTAAPSVGLR